MSWRSYRIEIRGRLVCESAFHVGSGQEFSSSTDAPVTRDERGSPYIPGTSLRGVIRHRLESEKELLGCDRTILEELFGSAAEGHSSLGRLRIEDAYAENAGAITEVRDHVRINRETGASDEGAKFDGEAALTGATLQFCASYEGDGPEDAPLVLLEEALRLLESGDLAFGAKSGWGLGRMHLENVEHRIFDRMHVDGLAAWFASRSGSQDGWVSGRPGASQPKFIGGGDPVSVLEFVLRLRFEGPVLVKAPLPPRPLPKAELDEIQDQNERGRHLADAVFIFSGSSGNPYLPGSSMRGVLRTRAERIGAVAGRTKLVERLFGSEPGKKPLHRGLIEFDDGKLHGDAQYLYLDHVAIDRILGGAADGAKFSASALDGPVFQTRVRLRFRRSARAVVSLWARLLRDLLRAPDDLWMGSGTSRGYGCLHHADILQVKLDVAEGALGQLLMTPVGERPGRLLFQMGDAEASDHATVSFEDLMPIWRAAEPDWAKEQE